MYITLMIVSITFLCFQLLWLWKIMMAIRAVWLMGTGLQIIIGAPQRAKKGKFKGTVSVILRMTMPNLVQYPWFSMVPSIQCGSLDSVWYPRFSVAPSIQYGTLNSVQYPWFSMVPLIQYGTLDSVRYPWFSMARSIQYGTLDSVWYPWFSMVPLIQYGTLKTFLRPIMWKLLLTC